MNYSNSTIQPLISVILCFFNAEKYLREAIESVLKQSYKNFEFIIINDGSTDNSKQIIESFDDKRIRYFSQKNQGLTKSLNNGLNISRGEFIARMDADDICELNRFEKQVNFLSNHKDVYLCGSWAHAIDENGNKIKDLTYPPLNYKAIKKYQLFHNPFIHPSVMFKKEIINTAGPYDSRFKYGQDYELWSRVLPIFKSANIEEKLIKYRILNDGVTKKNNLKVRLLGVKIRINYIKNLIKKILK